MSIKITVHRLLQQYQTKRIRRRVYGDYHTHHFRAQLGDPPDGDLAPHEAGLYGALSEHYERSGETRPCSHGLRSIRTLEAAPFMGLPESEAVDVLAEYIVWKETDRLEAPEMSWLRSRIEEGYRSISERHDNEAEYAGFLDFSPALKEFRSSEPDGDRACPDLL